MHPRTKAEWVKFLKSYDFTHFVTLALNDPMISLARADRLLRSWEARMNYLFVGSRWSRRPDERIFAFYFLEKPSANPHWHGLVMFDPDPIVSAEQAFTMEWVGEQRLKRIHPSGTFRMKPIYDLDGVVRYATKDLGNEVSYLSFRLPKGRRPVAQGKKVT